ncbi:nucleotidyl transferase AbiEii/AbiGii toxin family protein [Pseudomonas sp. HN2-3]|uniref:nucleotidyl transferase AbiEii/AbiGii toxin family protein n=1 Tax=Pseudomonas sp. HN2-3 TaxID=2886360 RepID=UPI001D107332|nr:nucleotidyl transferase AbiEii/AbiGii toxin family protein [Pseudomonas sp. HN2-3]UDU83192.1 nucleotidyl transferase AbiEii/AbiGii toxin family protein [Pseudomonas sp. HN2-3]
MKTLSEQLRVNIEDASTAGILKSMPAAVAEKDQHITDALHALSQIQVTHVAAQLNRKKGDPQPATVNVETRMVFAGGTCLSKAYGLIERMSEDIDIKVELDAPPEGYAFSRDLGDRSRLKALHAAVEKALADLDFHWIKVERNPTRRDGSRYYCLMVSYGAHFQDATGTLRSQLKIELVCRPPMIPSETQNLGYMLEKLSGSNDPFLFSMQCITVAETLAEKVLSLLRRCASSWDGRQVGEFDTALVRHVYDVWRIATSHPEAIEPAAGVFASSVAKDVAEFGRQHPEFGADPFGVLRQTLEVAATHDGLKANFEQRLMPLLYAHERPDYETCFAAFADVARQLLDRVAAGEEAGNKVVA